MLLALLACTIDCLAAGCSSIVHAHSVVVLLKIGNLGRAWMWGSSCRWRSAALGSASSARSRASISGLTSAKRVELTSVWSCVPGFGELCNQSGNYASGAICKAQGFDNVNTASSAEAVYLTILKSSA